MKSVRFTALLAGILLLFPAMGQTDQKKWSDSDSLLMDERTSAGRLLSEANRLQDQDAARSMKFASEALNRSIQSKDRLTQYAAYNTLGTLYYNIGNYSKAAAYFTSARDGFRKTKNQSALAYAERYLVLSLEKQGKYKEALSVNSSRVTKKSKEFKEADNSIRYDKARLKSKVGDKEEAISEYKVLTTDSTVLPEKKAEIYNNLGDLYVAKKDTLKALQAYYNVVDLNQTMQGGFTSPKTESAKGLTEAVFKISELNLQTGQATENIAFQKKLIDNGLRTGDLDLVQAACFNIGKSYLAGNDLPQAVTYLTKSLTYARQNGNIEEEQKSIRELAGAYERSGQYTKALEVYKRYVVLADSFAALQKGNEATSLALNAEFLKQEQRIKGLIRTQKEKERSLERTRNLAIGLGTGILLFTLLTWALIRNIRQKKKANMVIRLQSLRTQMNPHFIFNSLNSVNNFISKNDEVSANRYISDFSKLMRTVLKNSDQDFVSLSTEIETLGIYLELEHFRFGDKFDYSLEVSPEVEPDHVQIPPMLIQPYIENAIWHGLRYKEEKGLLQVRFFQEGKQLYCMVYDNGIGRKRSSELKTLHQKSYQSTGIRNTRERIEILNKLHRTQLDITITDIEDGTQTGTLVKISLPHKIFEEV